MNICYLFIKKQYNTYEKYAHTYKHFVEKLQIKYKFVLNTKKDYRPIPNFFFCFIAQIYEAKLFQKAYIQSHMR